MGRQGSLWLIDRQAGMDLSVMVTILKCWGSEMNIASAVSVSPSMCLRRGDWFIHSDMYTDTEFWKICSLHTHGRFYGMLEWSTIDLTRNVKEQASGLRKWNGWELKINLLQVHTHLLCWNLIALLTREAWKHKVEIKMELSILFHLLSSWTERLTTRTPIQKPSQPTPQSPSQPPNPTRPLLIPIPSLIPSRPK